MCSQMKFFQIKLLEKKIRYFWNILKSLNNSTIHVIQNSAYDSYLLKQSAFDVRKKECRKTNFKKWIINEKNSTKYCEI